MNPIGVKHFVKWICSFVVYPIMHITDKRNKRKLEYLHLFAISRKTFMKRSAAINQVTPFKLQEKDDSCCNRITPKNGLIVHSNVVPSSCPLSI